MKNAITLTLCLFLLATQANAQTINASKSSANFEISNFGLNTVEGSFKGMTGDITFNPSDLGNAQFNVCVDATTVNTDSEGRDEHLQKADFFDTNNYGVICFKSSSVRATSKGYEATGVLTMHGITKDVKLPFTYANNTFKGSITVNRFDYKIGEDSSRFTIGSEATVEIICVVE